MPRKIHVSTSNCHHNFQRRTLPPDEPKIIHNLGHRQARGEIGQDVVNRDAHAAKARVSATIAWLK